MNPRTSRSAASASSAVSGFTLLELAVATTIFAIVLSAAYALFESSRTVSVRAELRARLFQTARAALRAIEEDLRGAVLSASAFDTELVSTNRGTGDLPLDKIEIVAVNAHPPGRDDIRIDLSRVIYSVDEEASTLIRERETALTPPSGSRGGAGNIEDVAPDVVGLDFRFYDTAWRDSWDSTTQNKLPKAIEVSVVVRGFLRDEPVLERFQSRFYLPLGAETPERQPQ